MQFRTGLLMLVMLAAGPALAGDPRSMQFSVRLEFQVDSPG